MSIKYLGESGTKKIITTLASCRGICNTQLDELSEIINNLSELIEDMNKIVNNIEIQDSSSEEEQSSSSSEEEQSSSSSEEEQSSSSSEEEQSSSSSEEEQSSSSSEEEQSSSSIGDEEIDFITEWTGNKIIATKLGEDVSVFLNSWRPVLVDADESTSSTLTPNWLMRNNWLRYMDDNTEIDGSDDSSGKFAPTIGITEDDAWDFKNYELYILGNSGTTDEGFVIEGFYEKLTDDEELWNNDKDLIQAEIENKTSGTSYDNPLPEYPTQVYVGIQTNGFIESLYENNEICVEGSTITINASTNISELVLSAFTYLDHDVYYSYGFNQLSIKDTIIVYDDDNNEIEVENAVMSIYYLDKNNEILYLQYNSNENYYYYSDNYIINSTSAEDELYETSSSTSTKAYIDSSGNYYIAWDVSCNNIKLYTDKNCNVIYYFNEFYTSTKDGEISNAWNEYEESYNGDQQIYTLYFDIYGNSVSYDSDSDTYTLLDDNGNEYIQIPEKYVEAIYHYSSEGGDVYTRFGGCYGYFVDGGNGDDYDFCQYFYKSNDDDDEFDIEYPVFRYDNSGYYYRNDSSRIVINDTSKCELKYIKMVDESEVARIQLFLKLKYGNSSIYLSPSSDEDYYFQERTLIPVSHIRRPWETTSTNYTIGVATTRDQYIIDEYLYRGINLEEIDSNSHDNYILNAGTAICPGPPFSNSEGALRNFFFTYNIGGENSSGGNGLYDGINTFNGSSEYENRNHARLELLSDIGSSSNYNWQTLAQANNSDSSSTTPFSMMGYHPLNAIITGCEALYGSKNPYTLDLFGKGLEEQDVDEDLSEDEDVSEDDVDYARSGGIWWKVTQVADTTSYGSYITSDWVKGSMGLKKNVSSTEGESVVNFATNLSQVCMTVPMEAQMALSYAMEVGIPAEKFFTFYGNVYCWTDVNDSGTYGPEQGYLNAKICKVLSDDWYYSLNSQVGIAPNVMATAEVIFFLRYSLYMGIDIAGEFPRNCDNGATITISEVGEGEVTASELKFKLNPSDTDEINLISDEAITIMVDTFDQRYNFTPIPYKYGSTIYEGYAWVASETVGETEGYTGSLYVGDDDMPRSISIYNINTDEESGGNTYTFGSLQFMVDI